MESTAHFYNPKDASLEEKLRVYKEAFQQWQNIGASFKFNDEQEWSDRLGSKNDLLKAKEITEKSLNMAVSSLSHSEVKLAVDRKLMSESETEYLLSEQKESNKSVNDKEDIIEARKKEFDNVRKQKSQDNSKNSDFDKS